uniref:Uncharacterized protein n=1 Tax=Nelumbo nucifera TaxID=4432 RepID=A0A822ZT62_NELNU|nr:TPA_asm: hypothetical protein HUJ06_004326 [Nelumbo nucifera]
MSLISKHQTPTPPHGISNQSIMLLCSSCDAISSLILSLLLN